ncbi:sulfurtransferase [Oscillatoria sp. CS-180]|uniref:sulfurtransferase n=1 Tax=Oscillatoria sp. CS-180 TaxID=3021720 RepID=UPI00232C8AD4|nr:sulfurtransferase [Oscillatoria sp. CS-180]MDB9527234.1 sulfurtransferase [Oscillatoria sp. CS-180]
MSHSDPALPTPLVEVDWLKNHLDDPQVVIIDCRFALSDSHQGRRDYQESHLPGAFYLDLDDDLSGPVQGPPTYGGRHPLPDLNQLVATFEALGISSDPVGPTQVVAYDASKGAFAARVWWLLRYLGHESVAVLDGGFPAWQAVEYPLSQAVPDRPLAGQFTPRIQEDWLVDRVYVLEHKDEPGTVVVDARSPERYQGEQEPIDPIAGSVPGAVNLFWQLNLNETGHFRSARELETQWSVVPSAETPIYYCGSGVTACVNILAQALMQRPLPKLYLGGWSDWCSYNP